MRLNKFAQSGFSLTLNSGFQVLWDIGKYSPLPEFDETPVIGYFLVSHVHADHFFPEMIEACKPQHVVLGSECAEEFAKTGSRLDVVQVKKMDKIKLGDEVEVTFFEADHGPNAGPYKENFGFLFNILSEDKTIYFAGDMFNVSGLDISDLEVDYALIPVGGYYTFDPEAALEFARLFKKIGKIFPMHYEKTPETKQKFIELAKAEFSVIEDDYVSS